jgi:hypothetical protein
LCFFLGGGLLTSPSLLSYPYSYPLHFPSFSCATIHCTTFQLLFLPLLIHYLQLSSPPLLSSPKLLAQYPFLLHTHHLLTSLLYQLYTIPVPCKPCHKHPPLQKQKYIQIDTMDTKPSSSCIYSPTNPPLFPPPFCATFTNFPNLYI